jgi:hypothetical protein
MFEPAREDKEDDQTLVKDITSPFRALSITIKYVKIDSKQRLLHIKLKRAQTGIKPTDNYRGGQAQPHKRDKKVPREHYTWRIRESEQKVNFVKSQKDNILIRMLYIFYIKIFYIL